MLAQASIYFVAAARWSIRAGALVRLGRQVSPRDLQEDGRMSGYAVAQIDEIDEIDDGRVLSRP